MLIKCSKTTCTLIAILMVLMSPLYVSEAFAHGGGGDVAPPVSFKGKDVTVSTTFNPPDITVGEVDKATIDVRFFDTITNENIKDVTFQIELWKDKDLLARNTFYDDNGEVKIDIIPTSNCTEIQLIKCTKYFGEIHPVAGGLYTHGTTNPQIKGPIFDKGGLYYLKVDIVGATSAKTLLAEPLYFDLFVSIADKFDFEIPTAQAQPIPIVIKTYYDDVSNFKFGNSDNSISFDMPFNWDPNYISQVKVVHEEIQVPKNFSPITPETTFKGYVDGVEVDNQVIILDPSSDQKNVIHFMVSQKELNRINQVLGSSHFDDSMMFFKLVPQGEIQKKHLDINFDSGAVVKVAWDSSMGAGNDIPFEFTFFDDKANILKSIRYGYNVLDENGNEIIENIGNDPKNPGILAFEGINTQEITIPSQNPYTLRVAIFGQGINNDLTYSGIAESILKLGLGGITPPTTSPEILVPSWIKFTAGVWVDGDSSDSEFISAIKFLVEDKIIVIPPTTQGSDGESNVVPSWIRFTTGVWVDGNSSDDEFINAVQFLIKEGIIKIEA